MANYPLTKLNKEGTLFMCQHGYLSDEYCDNMCDLYLHDEFHKNERGEDKKYYRLHAKESHSIEMALRYEIKCPTCSRGMLKKATRCNSYHDLGLYECPVCNEK